MSTTIENSFVRGTDSKRFERKMEELDQLEDELEKVREDLIEAQERFEKIEGSHNDPKVVEKRELAKRIHDHQQAEDLIHERALALLYELEQMRVEY